MLSDKSFASHLTGTWILSVASTLVSFFFLESIGSSFSLRQNQGQNILLQIIEVSGFAANCTKSDGTTLLECEAISIYMC